MLSISLAMSGKKNGVLPVGKKAGTLPPWQDACSQSCSAPCIRGSWMKTHLCSFLDVWGANSHQVCTAKPSVKAWISYQGHAGKCFADAGNKS